jgi:hypothetical protein
VVHVTAAGVAAAWYFQAIEPNAVTASLRRALTTSLGSICFGSLVVGAVQSVRSMGAMANQQSRGGYRQREGMVAVLFCCCSIAGALCERIIQFLNMYAYTQVAIYGYSFVTASKACWSLLLEVGLLPLLHSKLLQGVLVSERLRLTPLQNCRFTPELQRQSRGECRILQGCKLVCKQFVGQGLSALAAAFFGTWCVPRSDYYRLCVA